MHSIEDREAAIMHLAASDEWIAALRTHVREIVEGEAFKGSSRCGRFLTYIVDQSTAGHFDSLKERVIGLELFGRSPAYDTSEDAIVRVTASDVRKRLLQHYGKYGASSQFRINLPLGSYVPEIISTSPGDKARPERHPSVQEPAAAPSTLSEHRDSIHALPAEPEVAGSAPAIVEKEPAGTQNGRSWMWWLSITALLVVFNLAVWVVVLQRAAHSREAAPIPALPWSVLFSLQHPTHLITSDPDIGSIQILTHNRISLTDYANHNFIPEHSKLTPEVKQICLNLLAGDKAATIDAQIAADMGELAKSASKTIDVQGARLFQFSNLKTDDNFIFLGSPSSDPWTSVFNDQLDFRIVPSSDPGGEMIQNIRPAPNEQTSYVPTARGGVQGESFAVIALVGNPDQYGQVLLLAGLNREGTQAAGRLITDLPRLSTALENCGISPAGPLKHFEMVLRVKMMAGYPSQFDVAACHIKSSAPAR